MYYLTDNIEFPDVEKANKHGMLALGGDLSAERLVLAYQSGIFPWYDYQPILWWSPDPRFVLFPNKLKVSKSMKQFMRQSNLNITINKDFESVIRACATTFRPYQGGTWITDEMTQAYINFHKMGYAISVEAWSGDELVGGLYGVDVGNGVFCGESMFTQVSNASKMALISFIQSSNYQIIDCQVYTKHLESLGAEEMPRREFIKFLK